MEVKIVKLSKETFDVLKNYAKINLSLLVKPGNTLRTCSPQKNVLAIATIAEDIPKQFAIYDLNQFLGTISLFEDPDFSFGDKAVKISNGTGAVANYTYAAEEAIVSAPEKDIVLKDIGIEFDLEEDTLSQALKAASVIGLPNVAFIGRKKKVYVSAVDAQGGTKHSWEMPVGTTEGEFKLIYRLENLNFLPKNYHVEISTTKGHTKFTSSDNSIVYFIAAETGSQY